MTTYSEYHGAIEMWRNDTKNYGMLTAECNCFNSNVIRVGLNELSGSYTYGENENYRAWCTNLINYFSKNNEVGAKFYENLDHAAGLSKNSTWYKNNMPQAEMSPKKIVDTINSGMAYMVHAISDTNGVYDADYFHSIRRSTLEAVEAIDTFHSWNGYTTASLINFLRKESCIGTILSTWRCAQDVANDVVSDYCARVDIDECAADIECDNVPSSKLDAREMGFSTIEDVTVAAAALDRIQEANDTYSIIDAWEREADRQIDSWRDLNLWDEGYEDAMTAIRDRFEEIRGYTERTSNDHSEIRYINEGLSYLRSNDGDDFYEALDMLSASIEDCASARRMWVDENSDDEEYGVSDETILQKPQDIIIWGRDNDYMNPYRFDRCQYASMEGNF